MNRALTIVIPARNASRTIARAVSSARAEGPARIVLVDHDSLDDTTALARAAGGDLLEVVDAPADATLGRVRQIGLEAVRTPFGMWLDADDELIPGRGVRLVGRLKADEGDLAFDEVDLHDQAGELVRHLPIPMLLGSGRQSVREFERNYLPGPGVPAFRTASALRVGFDPALHGAEDYDFLLRAIAAGQRLTLVRQVGYRQFASPATLSRDIENQTAMTRAALRKHEPADVEALFRRAGYLERTVAWGMASFLTMRGDYEAALTWLDRVPVGSRRDFQVGTLLAALGRNAEALGHLERAFYEAATAELLNNFGVMLHAAQRRSEATEMFVGALNLVPDYQDAYANLRADPPTRLTLLPMRQEPARSDY